MSTTLPDKTPRAALTSRRERLVLGLLTAALAGLVVQHTLTLPMPGTLVVAAPRQTRVTADASMSFEKTLLERFAREQGVELTLVLTDTPEQALEMVEDGRAQLGLALGVAPHELSAHEAKAARRKLKIAYGPEYDRQPIYAVDWAEGYAPPEDASGALDELLRVAQAFSSSPRQAPALPLDALHLLLPFVSEVRDAAPTRREASYRFVWRTDVPRLDAAMRAFWNEVETDGSLAALQERTMGFLPADPDPFEMEMLRRTLAFSVPEHRKIIERAARKWRLDPCLLTAVIHQESRFDPAAVSATGVRGLMQMTTATLEELGVQDPENPTETILAGARYLNALRAQFVDMGYGPNDAMLLALASFNVGLGHVQDAIDLMREDENDLPSWLGVRAALPLLARADVASATRHGACRGAEAVDFVDKVRYFTFAIRGLVLASAQGNELPGLRLALAD
ncbi:membrane-bound lytic murein transglycosylase F [Humidesulfovibrio mexicanus]|uniref:Membrane-bound lytic murein transglycosylase F n=1 Tax=Humidesulfovibrio mexicanus TaxID=147047 RepID=A0A239B5J1_9BACT|nr:transglycosylase SLT domain-containing protein [Humidesulfovibrio mexicanus]SNS02513.1 membrane-bound lytic murein transglycosylase F [Humidesulfovibrio mexicanus]